MPNIILTEYCNLKCPYCFADKMIKEKNDCQNISLEQLDQILTWLLKSVSFNDPFILGLIGGEPTLHPQFSQILEKINIFNTISNSSSIIFTNGLKINEFLTDIGLNTSILVNINKLSKNKEEQLIYNLKLINSLGWFENKKVTLGCNLYLDELNYNYFWNIVDLFSSKISIVRMSVTAPATEELKNNKNLYYSQMKERCLIFLKEAKKRNISISFDCNQIPLCFFNEKEQDLIKSLGDYPTFCSPVVDITPDFKATCCFGCYNTIDCNNFQNFTDLIRYFKNQMALKLKNNKNSLCENCEKIDLHLCQGGCLAFSQLDKNK